MRVSIPPSFLRIALLSLLLAPVLQAAPDADSLPQSGTVPTLITTKPGKVGAATDPLLDQSVVPLDSKAEVVQLTAPDKSIPKNGCTATVIHEIENAKKSILFQTANSKLNSLVLDALILAKLRGLQVEGLLRNKPGDLELATSLNQDHSLRVYLSFKDIPGPQMIIIDDKTLITGTFAFPVDAQMTSPENLSIIHDDRKLIDQANAEWKANLLDSIIPRH